MLIAMGTVLEWHNTPCKMATIWLDGIRMTMHNSEEVQTQVPHHLQQLAESQTAMGWKQIMKKRQWILHQQEAMGKTSTKRKNANTWAITMINTIFTQWLKLKYAMKMES
jgi:hypothetical protein